MVLQAGTREVGWSRGDTPEHVLKIVTFQTLRFIEKVDGNPRLHFWGSCQARSLLPLPCPEAPPLSSSSCALLRLRLTLLTSPKTEQEEKGSTIQLVELRIESRVENGSRALPSAKRLGPVGQNPEWRRPAGRLPVRWLTWQAAAPAAPVLVPYAPAARWASAGPGRWGK